MKFNIGERELEFDVKTFQIKYNDKVFNPSIRTFGDMKKLYSNHIIKELDGKLDDNIGLYFMYRDVILNNDDEKLFRKNNVRYDITVLLPILFGNEYNKTYGHYHPENKSGNMFQEIYEVLSGNAIYLQQNNKEVKFTNAFIGDKVIMNESFGHVTINPNTDEFLVMANLVDDTFSSVYDDYKSKFGANYLYKTSGFEMNSKYLNGLSIKESEELFEGDNLYDQFLIKPENFNFLH